MSKEEIGMPMISLGKSKKIKFDNEKNIKVHTGPQSIGELEWINHEIIIKDEHVEEKSNNGTSKSCKTTKFRKKIIELALPPIISDHDYIFHNSKETDQEAITLHKDSFCVKSKRRNHVLINSLETFNESLQCSSKVSSSKTEKLEIDSKLKFKAKLIDDKIDGVNLSDNFNQGIIDLSITSEGPEHSSNSELPVILMKVDSKSVPLEIKARTLLKANMNLPSNFEVSQAILKQNHPSLKVVTSKTVLTENKDKLVKKNELNVNLVHVNEDLSKSFGQTCNSRENLSINNPVRDEFMMEKDTLVYLLERKDSSRLTDQVKYGATNKNIITVSVHDQNSYEDNSNVKENYQSDISEVRLSSLANPSQVAIEYGTTQSTAVLQNKIKTASSANIAGTNNIDPMKDISDEDTDEELGLNSLEELEQFWEFLIELHDYNKQMIRSLQNKKRRYLLRIKKIELDLQQNFGIELEKCEDKNYESSDENINIT